MKWSQLIFTIRETISKGIGRMTQLLFEYTDSNVLPRGRFEYWTGRLKQLTTNQPKSLFSYAHNKNSTAIIKSVALAQPRKLLIKELQKSQRLGTTADGKHIYLYDYRLNSRVLREIGRLREIAFRAVGEGTYKSRDTDRYDKYYRHIVLWDPIDLEIVGAYRIGEAFKLFTQKSANNKNALKQLYSYTLFEYKTQFTDLFPQAIELGRSFIQPKYWGKRGLDYLWLGIGAYLNAYPHVRYMFGPVSLSNDYPVLAKQQITSFYQHYFRPDNATDLAVSRCPFTVDKQTMFDGLDYKEGLLELKKRLKQQGQSVPTLFKHYAEFCHVKGTHFIDFNVDASFADCIDGLVLIDLHHAKKKKRLRYIDVHVGDDT